MDLLDLWRPASHLTWRKLGVLFRELPAGSRTMTAIRVAAPAEALRGDADPADARWSHTDMLLAGVIDAIHSLQWTYVARHSKTTPKRPEPIRRPGTDTEHGNDKGYMTAAQYRMLTGEAPPLYLIQGGG